MKTRGFEVAKGFEDKGIILPERATKNAAGYDFRASETVVVPSLLKYLSKEVSSQIKELKGQEISPSHLAKLLEDIPFLKPTLVPTGVKSYMQEGEFLQLCNRSSGPMKKGLIMTNGVGVIDGDYYENESNDGHIMFQFYNVTPKDIVIEKDERIGQGIFLPFLLADGDNVDTVRTGGFGSSGNK